MMAPSGLGIHITFLAALNTGAIQISPELLISAD